MHNSNERRMLLMIADILGRMRLIIFHTWLGYILSIQKSEPQPPPMLILLNRYDRASQNHIIEYSAYGIGCKLDMVECRNV